jgi:hypothetical protein
MDITVLFRRSFHGQRYNESARVYDGDCGRRWHAYSIYRAGRRDEYEKFLAPGAELPFPLNKISTLINLETVEEIDWSEVEHNHAFVKLKGVDEPQKIVIDQKGLRAEKEARQQFACDQERILIAAGFEKESAKRILSAAGPALAVPAAAWAKKIVEGHEWGSPRYDMALTLLQGALSRAPGGCDRIRALIEAAGLPPVEWKSHSTWSAANLNRFLKGAQSALLSETLRFAH